MKNLKKVLALVVALTMVLGTVSFASFSDVAEDSDVYTAVQTLSSLSILNGYEDGTFGPEKDITRAEFATVVCRALGLGNPAKGATQFADVPADHWAAGYINLVAGQGIVNGYGDGNFGPEDNVTYEQAVKMLVVALGYEPMAAQKGGYPTGYLVVANTYGLTEGVNAPADAAAANRGVVAHLTYNALDIPMMAQTGFGTNVEYKILDGNNDTTYTTLLTGLDVVKLDGVVVKTPVIGELEIGSIEFEIRDDYDSEDFAISTTPVPFTLAEGVNAEQYFGYASTIYAKEVRTNKWEIIAIMPGSDSETLEMDMGDIEVLSDAEVKYYQTATATKTTNVTVDKANLKVYYNNALSSVTYLNTNKATLVDAGVTLINNDADSAYEMIVVKNYDYAVVKDVEASRSRINLEPSGRFVFDFEDETVSNTIVNKDGEAIELADIAAGDVLAYITSTGTKSGFTWCEVINLGQSAVTGAVSETNGTESIFVDGVEYELKSGVGTFTPGDEGIFYLTKEGKIFKYDLDATVASNYAYILEMAKTESGFSTGWQIKLLTKEGKIETYDVRDQFSIGDSAGIAKDAAWNELAALANVASDGVNASDDFKTKHASERIVTYKLDSNGKIREINPVAIADTVGAIDSLVEFKGNAMTIQNNLIEDDATIFNLVSDNMDNVFVTTASSLVDEGEYAGFVVANAKGQNDLFVIIDGKGAIDYAQDIAIVESVNTVTVNEDPAYKVRYYTANDDTLKEVTITDDTTAEDAKSGDTAQSIAAALHKGDIIMVADDGNGVATCIALIAQIDNVNYTWTVSSAGEVLNADLDLDIVIGYIDDIDTNGNIVYSDGNGPATGRLALKGSENAYTYYARASESKSSVIAGDWMGAPSVDYDTAEGANAGKTYFFAIVEEGIVSDIITHSSRK